MDQEVVTALQNIVGAENVSDAKPVVDAYVTRAIMDVSGVLNTGIINLLWHH